MLGVCATEGYPRRMVQGLPFPFSDSISATHPTFGTILTRAAQPGPAMPCYVASNCFQAFVDMDMTFTYGTQGIVCVLRPLLAARRGPLSGT